MRHPYENFIRGEIICIIIAIIIGLFSLISGYLILVCIGLLFLAISLLCNGLLHMQTYRSADALKQTIRAALLILLAIYLIVKL